jgi:hypothetical protein
VFHTVNVLFHGRFLIAGWLRDRGRLVGER